MQRVMNTKLLGCVLLGVVLCLPTTATAQTQTLDLSSVSASTRTLNRQLEEVQKTRGVSTTLFSEKELDHIQVRQVYYRLQRVARKAGQLGKQVGVRGKIRLPKRPKGEISPAVLQDMINLVTEHVDLVRASTRATKVPQAEILPVQRPSVLYNELGVTLAYLDTLTAARGVRAAPKQPVKPAAAPAQPARGRGRRR